MMCNMRFDKHGSFRCHGNLDKVLTPNGDQAVVSGDYELLRQSILIWASTPIGEDIDPKCGCILHNYVLAKGTYQNLRSLEIDLLTNMRYNFPDYSITSVRVIPVYDEDTNTQGIAVSALFNDEEINFIADASGLLEIENAMRKMTANLEYITQTRG